ncbi:DEAD/DEAH box helicase family protein [Sneathia sanguinegens]|uniref:DEAD/DEAH box helicase family protein n=1 Tax=Sneathia sanguinegens TaxID=40543 RepID=UPI00290CD146|nr:DEAD/DEAH box helicase family protein [Sneathia sanguinegens]MDU7496809.1 DEAD/DEAH box helicase family protein [Sneathia sanguinegens]
MDDKFLYEDLDSLKKFGVLKDLPDFLEAGLSENIVLRDYQKEAFQYFITYMENKELSKNKQIHTLFHMATGSGKTVIMAGLILYLYTKGYRNFLFFVNQTNILEKTKENFLNILSNKYLFSKEIEYLGDKVKINAVDNFMGLSSLSKGINICFTTTQKLHSDLLDPKENSLTYKDFEDTKIVFISDESHHVNTMTKRLTEEEEADKNSWEYSVMNAFNKNKDHVLLEFTATADIKDKNVRAKYLDKLIYNYPLFNFRQSGYTKDFQNFATNSSLWERVLMAIIMSEYRKYLFADAKVNIKPVVLFKSQIIKESESFYDEFFEKMNNLNAKEINSLYDSGINELNKALDYFKEKDSSLMLLINSLKEGFSKDKSIIMNGSNDNTKEQQLQINSLEDKDNPIRFIFAVDMLNEGWDVLNLFDIVRLYDEARQGSGKKGKIGVYTIKEAQLIGRGARYCPFKISDTQEKFKRKYDNDLENPHRILETMYFHSRDDSKYISELKQALIASGMEDENPIKITYELKDSFKESDIYKKGYVFSNRRVQKDRTNVTELEESKKNTTHYYTVRDSKGYINTLFGETKDNKDFKLDKNIKAFKFKDIAYNILSGAAESYRELKFSVLKEKYPHLTSMKEFLTSDKYLGSNILEISYTSENIKGQDIFNGLLRAFNGISSYILSLKPEYEGTKIFYPKKLSDVIKNKSIYISSIDKNGGIGQSQNTNTNKNYQLSLFDMEWYVFNDNYGTSEEKLFIKHFNREIKPILEEKGLKFFLVRNERIPELAIYSFNDGERFEPDFLLFVEKEKIDKNSNFQIYVEPKGSHLLDKDDWKEKFLLEIEENHDIENSLLTSNRNYMILGLPFYNEEMRKTNFDKAFIEWIARI